jgi:mannose-6-phosphate isomerase
MNSILYPLKFKPIFQEKIWGGEKIKTILNKDYLPLNNCGETWEISSVDGNISEVSEGKLKGQKLDYLIETYKQDLVGKSVFEKFGKALPLLIKFLDANADLSIQVHPNDEIANRRHKTFGKTEMWYVLQADENAKINVGFNQQLTKSDYLDHLKNGTLTDILNYESVQSGDVFFLPAGRIHYIGKGCLIAEIQQTSDVTYRIYDFDRVDKFGNKRELHTALALDCLDFSLEKNYKANYTEKINNVSKLVHCEYFKTNYLSVIDNIIRKYDEIDSFVIYIVVEGILNIVANGISVDTQMGDCILIPACLKNIELNSSLGAKLIEVWVD